VCFMRWPHYLISPLLAAAVITLLLPYLYAITPSRALVRGASPWELGLESLVTHGGKQASDFFPRRHR
jgi:hypothetical protein